MPLNWDKDDWQPPPDVPMREGTLDHIGGRKPLPDHKKRKRRVIYLTDSEWEEAKAIIEKVTQKHRG